MGRAIAACVTLVTLLGAGPELAFVAGGRADSDSSAPVSVATILAAPAAYAGQKVVIQGTVLRAQRSVFPNRRPYYTLAVGDRSASITVFSWARPSAKEGDLVEAAGIFHIWRYNLHHMVESERISRPKKTR